MVSQSVVYVVDDDPDARHVLVALAESMFHKTVACADAAEFLNCFDELTPSCLVTDMRMRGMSGLDLLRTLKASGKVIPTIIVTGYAETAVAVDAMLTGAVTFLEKTSPPHKICEAITKALSLSESLLEQKAERDRVLQISGSLGEDERQILKLVAVGKLNKEIAFEIGIPLRTLAARGESRNQPLTRAKIALPYGRRFSICHGGLRNGDGSAETGTSRGLVHHCGRVASGTTACFLRTPEPNSVGA